MQIVAGSTFLYGPDGARYKRQDRVAGGTLSRTVRYVGAIEREEYPSGERRIRHTIGGFLLPQMGCRVPQYARLRANSCTCYVHR